VKTEKTERPRMTAQVAIEERDRALEFEREALVELGQANATMRLLALAVREGRLDVAESIAATVLDDAPPQVLTTMRDATTGRAGLGGWPVELLMRGMDEELARVGAENFLEWRIDAPGLGIALRVERLAGKTPGQLLAEAKAARDEAVAEVERLRAELGERAALLRSAGRSRDTLDVVINRARWALAESPSAEGAAAALAVLDSVRAPAPSPPKPRGDGDHDEMAAERLAAIEARAAAARTRVLRQGESLIAGLRLAMLHSTNASGWYVGHSPRNDSRCAEGPIEDWRALAEAILGVRTADVDALVAEVRRQRDENERLRAWADGLAEKLDEDDTARKRAKGTEGR